MSQNVYDTLMERGFIEQCTHPEEVRELLGGSEPVTFYIGFDATADGRTFPDDYGYDAYAEGRPQAHCPSWRRYYDGRGSLRKIRYEKGYDQGNH